MLRRVLSLLAVLGFALAAAPSARASAPAGIDQMGHVIVIFQENWSFDSLYGDFPGATASPTPARRTQVDKNGQPYATLPQPLEHHPQARPAPTRASRPTCPVQPFDTAPVRRPPTRRPATSSTASTRSSTRSTAARWTSSSPGATPPGWSWATTTPPICPKASWPSSTRWPTTSSTRAFGGSFLNHFWLICACAPTWPNAPAAIVAQLDANGIIGQGRRRSRPTATPSTPSYTVNTPHPASITDPTQLVPEQTMPTIGDRLSDKGVSWAWYSGGWNDALAGHPDPLFQFHHQPFAFFANYADGTPGRAAHLKDEPDFLRRPGHRTTCPRSRSSSRSAPTTSTPATPASLHGQQHVADLVQRRPEQPLLGRHRDHHHLRRERRLLGPRGAAQSSTAGARARACRRSSSRRSPSRASSTTPSTTPPRS